jgi:hypothetical protein
VTARLAKPVFDELVMAAVAIAILEVRALAERLIVRIAGTARDPANVARLRQQGCNVCRFTGEPGNAEVPALLAGTTHLLLSIPPGPDGDPVLAHYRDGIASLATLEWIGYLSTVGVYGDHQGALVDETAELKPNQTDQDTLPPYELLDAILYQYVDRKLGVDEIARQGYDPALVRKIAKAVERCEYKRRQSAIILKVSPKAFGFGRRMVVAKSDFV